MPPAPSGETISYGPRRAPITSVISRFCSGQHDPTRQYLPAARHLRQSFSLPRTSRPVAGRTINAPLTRERELPMSERTLSIDGVTVPRFLYGTAWKEDQTQRLTEM